MTKQIYRPLIDSTLKELSTVTRRFWDASGLLKFVYFAVAMLFSVTGVAQTDYSGTYYIAGPGYNASNTTTNYYFCPTQGWIYYQAVNNFTTTDNGQPFVTTYQCRNGVYDDEEAIWMIEKHPTQDYYYIRRTKDGKYLVLNGKVSNATETRIRVHIETNASPGDEALFAIIDNGGTIVIMPKGVNGSYLNVNGGNKPSFVGEPGKTGGPTGYTTQRASSVSTTSSLTSMQS